MAGAKPEENELKLDDESIAKIIRNLDISKIE